MARTPRRGRSDDEEADGDAPSAADVERFGGGGDDDPFSDYDDEAFEELEGGEWRDRERRARFRKLAIGLGVGAALLAAAAMALY